MSFGEAFLHRKDQGLHTTAPVQREQARKKRSADKTTQKPAEKLTDWLAVLDRTHGHTGNPHAMELLKEHYHRQYVIDPANVPEATFVLEQRIAREMGYGDIEITDDYRERKKTEIVHNQANGLDQWLDYLTSADAQYPAWAKYWAFTSMVKMGRFNKEKEAFENRTKDTVATFPMLNPRALAKTINTIKAKIEDDAKPKTGRGQIENLSTQLSPEEFNALAVQENFAKLYAQFLKEIPEYTAEGLQEIRGEWVKYPQGSAPDTLVKSLEGYPLEWCTASPETAKGQLERGDFYVYYSLDQNSEPVIPRVAIRMAGENIGEIRGIAPNQNLDPYIAPVVKDKMAEFPDGAAYEKKSADMKLLTELEQKTKAGVELTKEELSFIYEIDSKIQGFGYRRDPRIEEVIAQRDKKADLSLVTGYTPEEISLTEKEALAGQIKFHYGDLDLRNLKSAEGLNLPENVSGDFAFNFESVVGLTLPQTVGGSLILSKLKYAEGLVMPKSVGGCINLNHLESAVGLILPQTVNNSLYLNNLDSTAGITMPQVVKGDLELSLIRSLKALTSLPQTIGGSLKLTNLDIAKGLTFPQAIGGSLDLKNLKSAENVILPQTVGGSLYLKELESADGLVFPQTVGGGLSLDKLKSAEGIVIPKSIGGHINLDGLEIATGLVFPQTIGGGLSLAKLKSAEGTTLPQSVGGAVLLPFLETAKGLTLPQSVGGDLVMLSLKSAKGLVLPQTIGGSVSFISLELVDGLKFPSTINGCIDLRSVTSAVGMVLPQTVSKDIYLYNIEDAEGVIMPKSVGGDLSVSKLKYAERLVLPESIGGDLFIHYVDGITMPKKVGGKVYLGDDFKDIGSMHEKFPNLRFDWRKRY